MTTKKTETTPPPEELVGATLAEEPDSEDASSAAGDCEQAVMEFLDEFQRPHVRGRYDQRLVSIARTQIELGFLALHKAIRLAEPEQPEAGQ